MSRPRGGGDDPKVLPDPGDPTVEISAVAASRTAHLERRKGRDAGRQADNPAQAGSTDPGADSSNRPAGVAAAGRSDPPVLRSRTSSAGLNRLPASRPGTRSIRSSSSVPTISGSPPPAATTSRTFTRSRAASAPTPRRCGRPSPPTAWTPKTSSTAASISPARRSTSWSRPRASADASSPVRSTTSSRGRRAKHGTGPRRWRKRTARSSGRSAQRGGGHRPLAVPDSRSRAGADARSVLVDLFKARSD